MPSSWSDRRRRRVHLADGTLSPPVIAVTAVGAGLALSWGSWRLADHDLVRCGLLGALILTASLIHIPLGGTSVHLLGLGIIGAVLGKRVFPALAASLALQALLLGYGGIGTLGASVLSLGIPRLLGGFGHSPRRAPHQINCRNSRFRRHPNGRWFGCAMAHLIRWPRSRLAFYHRSPAGGIG